MDDISKAMQHINRSITGWNQREPMPFEEFLELLSANPTKVIRNVFQVFHDMIMSHIGERADEYPDDPESIHFASYDCYRLFVEYTDHPFFADRLFANRLVNLVTSWKRGTQQNKIYIFEGPPGSGKSTFLNNLLLKFEKYANTEEGLRFETVWRLDRQLLGNFVRHETAHFLDKLSKLIDEYEFDQNEIIEAKSALHGMDDFVEIPCPSHDNPILMIPKDFRRQFFDDLFKNDEVKWRLFTEKEYEWVFKSNPCTICSSLYQALLRKLKDPAQVLKMVYAHPYRFNRRLGEGISVFNPGDKPTKQTVFSNEMLQNRVNALLRDSNQVKYIFSQYTKTNNGIYALMDIKSHNTERLMELHNIISEGVHKVEDLEENVDSLFIALMNPEDKKNIEQFASFSDRIQYIKIPYVLDLNTEVEIYRNIFGKHIDESFLPRVLHNFARIIISTRLKITSEAMQEWIYEPDRYGMFCDENLQLLKMEIYTGHIPPWLSDEDRKKLTAKRRRKIIAESENEGEHGFSGRDAINIFNDFYSTYARKDKLINMSILCNYFTKVRPELGNSIPEGFTDSLQRLYNFTVLQEVKESLYYYNEEQISREIMNYLFAINFEPGRVETCKFTGDKLQISESFFEGIENRLLGMGTEPEKRLAFRRETQKEYAARTLTQEMMTEGKQINESTLFQALRERYIFNLKEKVLDPFLENANFRRAIKDYGKEEFKTYDKKIRDDVTFLMNNLGKKYRYNKHGAREVCVYVIDTDLAKRFARHTQDPFAQ
ncbi:serine protein kinase PrkA [Geotalea uraniireducens]|uniref:Putative serine protein kinase, PrkA n=1 Tax=Geotalea uraniireducens (strain Rf4) TaxID=351605 RepID=A5G9I6_GEOUR|nr:serine protein kinase PrkA [Geotalea uraniireducens]ABQ28454.1 putative serine protein kinase, PrkA [Geotalea uraniireducens Rf4]